MPKETAVPGYVREGFKSLFSQLVGRGADTLVQNLLIYMFGFLVTYGEIYGYLYAAIIGGIFNITLCYTLKFFWAYRREGQDMQSTMVDYTRLRLYLLPLGIGITYLPIYFFDVEFFKTSALALFVITCLLLYYSPRVFDRAARMEP